MHAEGDSFVRLHTRSAWQIARLCSTSLAARDLQHRRPSHRRPRSALLVPGDATIATASVDDDSSHTSPRIGRRRGLPDTVPGSRQGGRAGNTGLRRAVSGVHTRRRFASVSRRDLRERPRFVARAARLRIACDWRCGEAQGIPRLFESRGGPPSEGAGRGCGSRPPSEAQTETASAQPVTKCFVDPDDHEVTGNCARRDR
jgi:hypothetical protein